MTTTAERLLGRVVDHVVEEGLADLSLRKLAAVAGTSHRMLQYHFGDREGLLGAVLHALRAEEQQRLVPPDETSMRGAVERTWAYFTRPERQLEMRIFFHLAGQAVEDPDAQKAFLDRVTSNWAEPLAAIGVREGREPATAMTEARLVTAGMRGLLLDLLLTGEHGAVDAAFQLLIDRVLGPGTEAEDGR